jgi:hypothetical protein
MRTVWSPDNRSPIVTSVSRVVPDWAHTWSPTAAAEQALGSFSQVQGEPAHWLDVDFTTTWDSELTRRGKKLSEREVTLRHRLGEWRSRIQQNSEALEEAAIVRDSLRDEVEWMREDLSAYEAEAIPSSTQDFGRKEDSPAPQTDDSIYESQIGDAEPPLAEGDSDSSLPKVDEEADDAPEIDEMTAGDTASQREGLDTAESAGDPDTQSSVEIAGSASDPVLDEMRGSLREREDELVDASRDEARIRREREQLRAREDRTTSALEKVEEQLGLLHECRDSLRAWVAERSGSFAWQLLLRLSQERQAAQSDFQLLRGAAETPIDPGVQRPSTMQDRFMRRALLSLIVVVLAWLLVVILKYSIPGLAAVAPAVNPIAWPIWLSALVGAGTFCLLWVLFLVTYYRENSRSRHLLRQASAYVEYLGATSLAAREEIQRLDALHDQVPGYLKYLSETIHRPWELPTFRSPEDKGDAVQDADTPESLIFSAARPRTDVLPSFMRLAESAPGAGGEKESALVRDTVRSLMHRGWRYGALCDLLSAAEEASSVPSGTFDPSRLDRDPRLRVALMSTLNQSRARHIAGRNQLRVLAQRIQLQVMDEIHPPVMDLAPDPLRDLQIDEDLLGATDWRLKDWDEFLSEALTSPSNWSSLAFSIDGLAQGIEDVASTGYGPERLAETADASVDFRGIAEKSTRPVELVVRVDRSGSSRGPGSFRVFSGVDGRSGAGLQHAPNGDAKDSPIPHAEPSSAVPLEGIPSTQDSLA